MTTSLPHRIMIFHPALAPYRIDLFNALHEKFNLDLYLLKDDLKSQSLNQKQLRDRLVFEPNFLTKGFSIFNRDIRLGIRQLIRKTKPSVVITPEFSAVSLAVASYKLLSNDFSHVLWTSDNVTQLSSKSFLKRVARKTLLARAEGLIVYSSATANFFSKHFGFSKPVAIVPNIMDPQVFQARLRQSMPVGEKHIRQRKFEGKRLVLYVGRLSPEKRIDRLLESFGRVATVNDVLVIVGEGAERHKLEKIADETCKNGGVYFVGKQEGESLAAWYLIASIFVLPSEHETFGAVVNEALCSGVPVIVSDQVGAKVLIKTGVNGAIFSTREDGTLDVLLRQWLDTVLPVSESRVTNLRESLLPVTFQDVVAELDRLINAVA